MAGIEITNRSDAPNEDSKIICREDVTLYQRTGGTRPHDYCLALVGKTGHGKSDTGNTILGSKFLFKSSHSGASVTKSVTQFTRPFKDVEIKVVDTPGCMDTELNEDIQDEIARVIDIEPQGYDAFLIVVRYPIRWTKEEQKCLKQLEKLFSKKFYDYCIVIFTFGDNFESDQAELPEDSRQSFEEYIANEQHRMGEGSMRYLLTNVKSRAVLFDNKGGIRDVNKREEIVDKLLNVIREMQDQNERSKYDNILFQECRRLHDKFPDNQLSRLHGLRVAVKKFFKAVTTSTLGEKENTCTCL